MMEDGEGRIILFADGKQVQFDEKKQAFRRSIICLLYLQDIQLAIGGGSFLRRLWLRKQIILFFQNPTVQSISQNNNKNPALDTSPREECAVPFFEKMVHCGW